MTISRRAWLGGCIGAPGLWSRNLDADLILHGANIITIDPANPRAQAVAIAGDRILAVGSDDDVLNLATTRTRKVNLTGRTVLPGFIDAHTHVAYSGIRHLKQVDCDLRSIAEIQNAIRKRAAATPQGQWIVGFKYDDTKTTEGRRLTRADLDSAAPAHPVFIGHRGGHTGYVNSIALKVAGVADATRDPSGGQYDRDPATGKLTGGLRERATEPFTKLFSTGHTRERIPARCRTHHADDGARRRHIRPRCSGRS